MSTYDTPPTSGAAAVMDHDPMQDLEAAARAFDATRRRTTDGPPTLAEFLGSLSFLITVGYLTQMQGQALLTWFNSQGTMPLPDLPGPATSPTPTMYEILSTSIRFRTPPEGASIIGDFFDAVGGLVEEVTGGIVDVLQAATVLIEAASGLVHELAVLKA